MPTLVEFGQYRDTNMSVEQLLLADPSYFLWMRDKADHVPQGIRERMQLVSYTANNFISHLSCARCDNPARYASLVGKTPSPIHVYSSRACFDQGSRPDDTLHKHRLVPLTLDGMVKGNDREMKRLVKFLTECMGIKDGRKSKQYLEEFFDQVYRSSSGVQLSLF